MNRKKIVRFVCSALIAGTVASAAPVFADEAKPAGLKPDEVKSALGISFYVQGGYTYNGNATDGVTKSSENDLRVFDHKANSFGVDLAQIVAFRDVTAPGTSGYKIKLSTGETAKWIHARGLSGATLDKPQAGEGTDTIDVTEAYASYMATVGKGLRFDVGKMATYFGAEVIEAIDDPNYSRSFLFNYAIPFTHTGLKMSYALTDTLNAAVYAVNGWDNAEDNNSGKSFGISIGYAPAEIFSGYVNFMSGPEQDSNYGNKRTLVDLIATIKPVKPLSLILNYDKGMEDRVPGALLPSGAITDAKWDGFAGIVKYDFNDKCSLSVRGESFNDKDGYRTGKVQKLTEVTVTPEFRLSGGVILRPEYRHDTSDQESFDNGTKKSQDTFALAAMYRW